MIENTLIYFKKKFTNDFLAGIVVFLVAIPLCMAIAFATKAPIYSGLISGICGGIVVGFLSKSHLSVSGPSAGSIAIILSTFAYFGKFEAVLLCLFIAGIIQLIAGLNKCGFIADYIPNNVIQGMLTAIGLLLIFNELPVALTRDQSIKELKPLFFETIKTFNFNAIKEFFPLLNLGGVLLTALALFLLWFLEKIKIPFIKAFPGAIIVVIIGTFLNKFFIESGSIFAQESFYLVNIPKYDSLSLLWQSLAKPDWSYWSQPYIYLYAGLITAVISLETLMSISATEKVDPEHEIIDKDRELVAQGVGNMVSAICGGIALSSVIVRTSVNIQSKAQTKMSTILHGFFLLLSFSLLPAILNQIPLCILSSILIYTGYKLTKPAIYQIIYQEGFGRFLPFLVTLIAIIMTNLFFGVLMGLATHLFFILRTSSQSRIDIINEVYPSRTTNRLILPQQTTFLNKASLIAELTTVPKDSHLTLDARFTKFIDREIIEFIQLYKNFYAPKKNITLNLIGFKDHYSVHNYIDFINVTTYDAQSKLSPKEVLDILKIGNERFLKDQRIYRSNMLDVQLTAKSQHPIAVILACIDSRVPVETIFDVSFGDLFCIRIAGNIINDDILASIEFACQIVGAKLIVVMGHTACGAIKAACGDFEGGYITQLLSKIKPAIKIQKTISSTVDDKFVEDVTELNVVNSMVEIIKKSPIIDQLINENKIGLVGAVYDVNKGKVNFSEYEDKINYFTDKKM